MNKFSIYQYLLILAVLVLGFIYALPNIYPTQPSIQVAYTDSGKSADQFLLNDLEEILDNNSVNYENIFLRDNKIVIQFFTLDQQLESKTVLQNKLLEAMSLGLPCITSPLANQALKAKDGEQILVANSLEQYIQQIDLLLSNQQIRESIGGKAREYIKAAFDWESSVAELEKIMKAKQNNI